MPASWEPRGPAAFAVDWAGTPWTLRLDADVPGLHADDADLGPVLGLESLSERGRRAPTAFAPTQRVKVRNLTDRVIADYAPLGWGALWIRATWSTRDDDALDLLVEVQCRSVDQLHALEVGLLSRLGPDPGPGAHRSVQPRDAHAAGLTYDGRESDLDRLVTGPPGEPLGPWLAPRSARSGQTYAELALADDISRRIHEGTLPFHTTRTSLFGHDLEKGVVLRGRLRALWLPKATAASEVERRFHAFRAEPPPLTT
jgi:hypothetical protein